jgi:hypothetical protein
MREKCIVFWPRVEGSVPLFVSGRTSQRRKPVWMFVADGAKIDWSERVISKGIVFVSNWAVVSG